MYRGTSGTVVPTLSRGRYQLRFRMWRTTPPSRILLLRSPSRSPTTDSYRRFDMPIQCSLFVLFAYIRPRSTYQLGPLSSRAFRQHKIPCRLLHSSPVHFCLILFIPAPCRRPSAEPSAQPSSYLSTYILCTSQRNPPHLGFFHFATLIRTVAGSLSSFNSETLTLPTDTLTFGHLTWLSYRSACQPDLDICPISPDLSFAFDK